MFLLCRIYLEEELDIIILFSQKLIKTGVQTLACKNLTFLFAKVWTPFFIGVKVDQDVAKLSHKLIN